MYFPSPRADAPAFRLAPASPGDPTEYTVVGLYLEGPHEEVTSRGQALPGPPDLRVWPCREDHPVGRIRWNPFARRSPIGKGAISFRSTCGRIRRGDGHID